MIYGTLSDYDYFIKMMREYKNKAENGSGGGENGGFEEGQEM